jgi:hypothetical protein
MVIEKHIRKHDFLKGGPEWVIIYGTKGKVFNPNYIWVPYIMSIDPVTEFEPTQRIVSRYAINTINNGYYTTISYDY